MCNLDYLNDVAMKVYLVDNQKGGKYYIGKKLESIAGKGYKILDISRNGTYGNKKQYGVSNHMQAMTVALNYIRANYAKK